MSSLHRRLAAHGLTLEAGERTTHGYTARWCLTGLPGGPAWFGGLEEIERWARAWCGKTQAEPPEQLDMFQEAA